MPHSRSIWSLWNGSVKTECLLPSCLQKLDKLGTQAGKRNVEEYCRILLETWEELPPVFLTSSETGRGRDEILDYIEQLNSLPVGSDTGECNPEAFPDVKYTKFKIF